LSKKPTLNWIDNLGTRADVPYCSHGYGAIYTMSIFDRYHRDDLSYEEGLDVIRKCIAQLEKRFPATSGGYRLPLQTSKVWWADVVGSRLLMKTESEKLLNSWRSMTLEMSCENELQFWIDSTCLLDISQFTKLDQM
jgi:20S proteasome alpha/beta subunit